MRSGSLAYSGHRFDVMPDGPEKRRHFAGDRGDDHRRLLAGRDQPAIAGAETDLSLPGNVTDGLRQSCEPGSQGLADAGRITVGPGPSTSTRRARRLPASVRPARRT